MRVFLDTEFTDFYNMQLISLGMVSEDGTREHYVEITDYNKTLNSQFVTDTVLPQLDPDKYGRTREQAGIEVRNWFRNLPWRSDDQVVLCVDFPADFDLLIDLMHGLIPANISLMPSIVFADLDTIAIVEASKRELNMNWMIGCARIEYLNAFKEFFVGREWEQHHALQDARANRHAWLKSTRWVKEYIA